MYKWLLFLAFIYFLYKLFYPILTIFKMSQTMRQKRRKDGIHKRVSKMDIQDAEFEDNLE